MPAEVTTDAPDPVQVIKELPASKTYADSNVIVLVIVHVDEDIFILIVPLFIPVETQVVHEILEAPKLIVMTGVVTALAPVLNAVQLTELSKVLKVNELVFLDIMIVIGPVELIAPFKL